MNPLDLLAIVLVVIAMILGIRSGALPQLLGLAGAAVAALAGLAILPAATPFLDELEPVVRAIVVLGALLGLIGLGEALGAMGGRAASRALGTRLPELLDRGFGALVGAAQAVLILWLAGGVIAVGPVPDRQPARTDVDGAPGRRCVPAAARRRSSCELGSLLDDSGLPDVFIGLEQLPAPAIDLPSDALAREIGERAAPSVLRVVAEGCDLRASGSSFVIADEYLVTNAHVIVGRRQHHRPDLRRLLRRRAVLVDLDLDVALLWVNGAGCAGALVHRRRSRSEGRVGATVGYPNGGNESVERATVAAAYFATGLDVTEEDRVTRRIIELRSRVIPGDSGGPFVLEDGTVGGVVFAESRVDPAGRLRALAPRGPPAGRQRDRQADQRPDRAVRRVAPTARGGYHPGPMPDIPETPQMTPASAALAAIARAILGGLPCRLADVGDRDG